MTLTATHIETLSKLLDYAKLQRKQFKKSSGRPYDRGAAEAYDDMERAIKAIAAGCNNYNADLDQWEKQ